MLNNYAGAITVVAEFAKQLKAGVPNNKAARIRTVMDINFL